MTGETKIILEEISGLRTELKAEISNVKTELKDEVSSLRAELKTELADEINGLRTELKTGFADEISSLRTEFKEEIKEEITKARKDFEEKFENNNRQMETIRFILENETRESIKLVAEGHQDLYRKMEEILKVNNEKEIMFIRLKYLESEVRVLKDKLGIA